MKKSQLYFLIGLPASGKTTWAKHFLSQNENFVYLSTDDIIQDIADKEGITYNEAFENTEFKEVQKEFNSRLLSAIKTGDNILWDQTNLVKSSREKKLKKFYNKNYIKTAILFDIPESKRSEYSNERKRKTGKHISHDVISQMKETMEINELESEFDYVIRYEGNYGNL